MQNKFLDLCHLQNIARTHQSIQFFLEIYGLEAPERVMVSTGAGPCQMSMMKFSVKIVNGEKLFTIFTKILHQRFDWAINTPLVLEIYDNCLTLIPRRLVFPIVPISPKIRYLASSSVKQEKFPGKCLPLKSLRFLKIGGRCESFNSIRTKIIVNSSFWSCALRGDREK